MNFEEMKYIFLVLINQFNIHEFQKFMVWLDKLVEEYKLSGSIAKYQYDMQISCSKCSSNDQQAETDYPEGRNNNDALKQLQKTKIKASTKKQQSSFNSSELNSSTDNESTAYHNDQESNINSKLGYLSKFNEQNENGEEWNGLNNNNNNNNNNNEYLDDTDMINQSESFNEILNTPSTVDFSVRKKRPKGFSPVQKFELEKLFSSKKYISTEERNDLAKRLDLTQVQIKDWFKNHRKLMRRALEQQQFKNSGLIATTNLPGTSATDNTS